MAAAAVCWCYSVDEGNVRTNCGLCHVPYKPASPPFPINLAQCASCRSVQACLSTFPHQSGPVCLVQVSTSQP